MKKQNIPLSVLIQNARQKMFAAVSQVQQETALPAFLLEGILMDVLANVREQKNNELMQDIERMNAKAEKPEPEPESGSEGGE